MLTTNEISPTIFRAYDIRGIVGDTLTENIAYLIGQAIGSLLREQQGKHMLVARDGRLSGAMLSQALCAGVMASGCDVYDLGMVPTPVLYYATAHFAERAGIMLTGSHNPENYNGMKIVLQGKTLAEADITALYTRIKQKRFYTGQGTYQVHAISDHYISAITQSIQLKRPLKIVIDAGNGVTGKIAPQLFTALGAKVIELFCQIDGHFPNHHPDPSDTKNLTALINCVQAQNADVGLAFDGDGDRLGIVTNCGEIILPDRLLMLFAMNVLAANPRSHIIYDVKCSKYLHDLITKHQGYPIMWKTGHSLIKAKMQECAALLAGEMSGHFFFKDRWHGFDDALYAGARLLEILSAQDKTASAVFATLPNSINTPELKVIVADEDKFALMQALIAQANFNDAQEMITIDGLRVHFAQGWGLVRVSNTSPCLVLRFEALNATILANIQAMFKQWLLAVEPTLILPF